MKTLLIVFLSLAFVAAVPIKDEILDDNEVEDGWFIPQKDGSLKWMSEEDAQLEMRAMNMLRKKSKEAKVKFYLYTQSLPEEPSEFFVGDLESLVWSGFNINHETKIIIHGYLNNYESDVNTVIREAYFSVGDYNVICVDWSDKADVWNYFSAVKAIPEIGQKVANMIEFLRDEAMMKSENLKVIGHSLGAHVAGYAGKLIQGEQIHTIIGLDTAFPLFKYDNCEERLCNTDALHVESIHTNGKILGFIQPIGDAAFYPNGGRTQPGCGLDISGSCSHSRAYIYFAEAIKDMFLGYRCRNWEEAVEKECVFDGVESVARFAIKDNHLQLEGQFYSPVNKKAPFSAVNV